MAALLALASSFVWGTADFFGGVMSKKRNPFAVVLLMQVFGLGFVAIWATLIGAWGTGDYWFGGMAAGVAGLLGLVSFYAALADGTMGVVAPIAALGVVIPLSYGLVRGEQPTSLQWMGILVAIIGIMAASGPELSGGVSARPLLLAGAAAAFFGIAMAFMASGAEQNPTMTIVAMRVMQVSIAIVVFIAWRGFGGITRGDLPTIAFIGLCDVAANVLFAIAAGIGPLSIVAVLGSLPPIATATLSAVLLKERLTAVQYVGVALAMAGVVLINAG